MRSVGLRDPDLRLGAGVPRRAPAWSGPRASSSTSRCPALSGLDLQRELAQRGVEIPIVFLTGHGDIPMTVRAMKAGAVEFLTKPVEVARSPGRDPRRDRTRACVAPGAARGPRAARALRTPHAARAGGPAARRRGAAQQADRRRARGFGAHGQVPPRAHHEEDGSRRRSRISCAWRSGSAWERRRGASLSPRTGRTLHQEPAVARCRTRLLCAHGESALEEQRRRR